MDPRSFFKFFVITGLFALMLVAAMGAIHQCHGARIILHNDTAYALTARVVNLDKQYLSPMSGRLEYAPVAGAEMQPDETFELSYDYRDMNMKVTWCCAYVDTGFLQCNFNDTATRFYVEDSEHTVIHVYPQSGKIVIFRQSCGTR